MTSRSASRSRIRRGPSIRRFSGRFQASETSWSHTSSRTSGTATASRWRRGSDIWLNEGFATYAEWLWTEHEGQATVQESFDDLYNGIPEDDPFWSVVIGDPTPQFLFDFAIYGRGAMTLQQLRLAVGDADFFEILRRWAKSREGENVTTNQFIRLAERVSGEDLDELFDTWLFTPGKPEIDDGDGFSIGLLLPARHAAPRRSFVGAAPLRAAEGTRPTRWPGHSRAVVVRFGHRRWGCSPTDGPRSKVRRWMTASSQGAVRRRASVLSQPR